MPTLTVLAGPNGAGKSVFSEFLVKNLLLPTKPFNPDVILDKTKEFLKFVSWENLNQEESRLQHLFFVEACEEAVNKKEDFSFECNLRKGQVDHIKMFEQAGYKVNLVYIFLNDLQISFDRVKYRIDIEKGNFVDKDSIVQNFSIGLENLDISFKDWNQVVLIDNSTNLDFKNIKDFKFKASLITENYGKIIFLDKDFPPTGIKKYLPNISKEITIFKEQDFGSKEYSFTL